jgi:hypothetical protein
MTRRPSTVACRATAAHEAHEARRAAYTFGLAPPLGLQSFKLTVCFCGRRPITFGVTIPKTSRHGRQRSHRHRSLTRRNGITAPLQSGQRSDRRGHVTRHTGSCPCHRTANSGPKRQQQRGNRGGLCHDGTRPGRCPLPCARCVFRQPPRSTCHASGAGPDAYELF